MKATQVCERCEKPYLATKRGYQRYCSQKCQHAAYDPNKARIEIYLPSNHYREALRAEARVRNMSVSSFMRAMIRGYFAAALHGR
jgi:hypothetical protein